MKLENTFTVPVPRKQAWDVLLDVERIAPCMPGATLTSRDGDTFTGTVKVKVGPINLTYGGKASFVSRDEDAGVAVIEGTGKETRGTGTAKATITCRLVDRGPTTDIKVDTDLAVTGKPASFGRGVLADVSAKLVDQFAACLSEEIQADPTLSDATRLLASGSDSLAVSGAPAATEPAAAASPSGPTATGGPADVSPGPSAATVVTAAMAGPAPTTTGAGGSGAGNAAGQVSGGGPATAHSGPITPPRPPRKPAEPINLIEHAGLPIAKRLAPVLGAVLLLVLLVRRLRR